MEIYIELIKVVIWPFTVLLIILLFRHELKRAAKRLSTLKYKDFQAQFEHDLKELEGDINSLPKEKQNDQIETSEFEKTHSTFESLLRIAEISPRAAIMEAWRDIEVTTKEVTDAYNISVGGRIAGEKAIRQLVQKGLLPGEVIRIYGRMRRLRASAAHSPDFSIDPEEAERYINTAYDFHRSLLFLLKHVKNEKELPKKALN